MIKAIVFDLGNVLIHINWIIAENRLNEIEQGLGTKATQFLKTNKSIILGLEKGEISDIEFLENIRKLTNSNLDNETIARVFSEIFWENKTLTSILPHLKNHYELYLLSNTNIIHRKYGWDHYEFLKHFNKLFLSYEIGAAKPERQIYDFVISTIKLKPSEVLYIDDIEEYVKAASNMGWNAIQFQTNEILFKEMKNFNIELDKK